MVTRNHFWTCLSFSVYFLVAPSGSGQQQTSEQFKRHQRADVGESTIYPPVKMSLEFHSRQKHSTFFIPLQSSVVSSKKNLEKNHKKFLEKAGASADNTTVLSPGHFETDLFHEEPNQDSTQHDNFQQGSSAQSNYPITSAENIYEIRQRSVYVGYFSLGGNYRPTNATMYKNETYLANGTTTYDKFDQEDMSQLYVQLGTEWIPKCLNDQFCYQKCQQTTSDTNAGHSRFLEAPLVDEIQCKKTIFYGNMCSCDFECMVYGDCCPDVFLHCWNISELHSIAGLIKSTRNNMLLNDNTDDLVDRLFLNPDSSEKILLNLYMQFGSCRQLRNGKRKQFIQAVGRCPSNAENSLKIKCEANVSPLLPPVYASAGSVEVKFSNVYCAQCHGVKDEQLTPFTSQIACTSAVANYSVEELSVSDLVEFIESGLCNVTFLDTSECEPRPCLEEQALTQQDLKEISQTGHCEEIDALLCSSYLYYVDSFRNPHCRKCLAGNFTNRNINSEQYTLHTNSQQYTLHTNSCIDAAMYSEKTPGGIYLFLDISGTYTDPNGGMTTKYPCHDNEVFDVLTQECKLLLCPRKKKAFRGQCQDTESGQLEGELSVGSTHKWTTLQMLIWSLTYQISCHNLSYENLHNTSPDLLFKEIVIKHSLEESVNLTNESTSEPTENGSWCTDNYQSVDSDREKMTSLGALMALKSDLDLATLEQLKQLPLCITDEDCEVKITSNFDGLEFESFCQNFTKYTPVNSTEHQGRVYVTINSTSEHGVPYLLQSLGYELRISRSMGTFEITETVLLCENSGLFSRNDCSVVEYTFNETLVNSSGLYVIKSGQFYETNDFEMKDDLVYVCSQFLFPDRLEEEGESTVIVILNLVFSSTSIMFLMSMVIIYCVFPSLQTLAGKMTASLAGTMGLVFMANILTFIETHNQYVCPVVAVLSHVTLLSQFGWMSAIAVNMAVTFGPSTLNNMLFWNSSAHFRRYNYIVYCVSLSIVMVPAILDFLHDDRQLVASPCSNKSSDTNSTRPNPVPTCQKLTETFDYPRYGYPVCSWFSGPLWARLTFVVVPFAISYIINIVCFIATLVGIHKSSKLTKKLGKTSSDRLQCVIYMKLSTAMGFTWLLSLLGNVLQGTKIIAYLFTVLILLQGLFLFLAFMANKRVFALIRRRWLCAGRSEQNSSGGTLKSQLYTSSTG